MGSCWSLPGEDHCRTTGPRLRHLGQLHHARHAVVDDAVSLQRRLKIWQAPGVVVFDLEMIHDATRHFHRRPATAGVRAQAIHGRVARTLGRQHARHRDDELQGRPADDQPRRRRVAGGQSFPYSDQMKTTERVTRLNDECGSTRSRQRIRSMLTRSFTVRYPMRNDPTYEWWEYACHEGNTIVQNYSETNRFERDHPDPEPPAKAAQVSADVANALAGRWTGRPRLATIDYDIVLVFTKNADGTVQGKLIGTNLKTFRGKVSQTIDKPVRDFTMKDRRMDFEFPNTQPWTFAGELSSRWHVAHRHREQRPGRHADHVQEAVGAALAGESSQRCGPARQYSQSVQHRLDPSNGRRLRSRTGRAVWHHAASRSGKQTTPSDRQDRARRRGQRVLGVRRGRHRRATTTRGRWLSTCRS